MKKCFKCYGQVHEDHLFCYHCGVDLRIPLCRFCNKELPVNSNFCPWCGKAQSRQGVSVPSALATGFETEFSDSASRFTREQLDALRSLLEKNHHAREFRFSEEKIYWCEMENIWGALDGSGMATEEITITPIHLDSFDLKDLRPGFCLENRNGIFSCFAHCAQGGSGPQIWSVCRDRFGRPNKEHYETVDCSDSMAVRNPLGIGVDILITYESYYYCD